MSDILDAIASGKKPMLILSSAEGPTGYLEIGDPFVEVLTTYYVSNDYIRFKGMDSSPNGSSWFEIYQTLVEIVADSTEDYVTGSCDQHKLRYYS